MRRLLRVVLVASAVACSTARDATAQFGPAGPVVHPCSSFDELSYGGLYTDKASYPTGGLLSVHGNWPNESVKYALLRVVPGGSEPHDFEFVRWLDGGSPVTFGAEQLPPFGSFVEFPGVNLSTTPPPEAAQELTIEGWVLPSYVWPEGYLVGTDAKRIGAVILAGQVSWTGSEFFGLGLGILASGAPFAVASIVDRANPTVRETVIATNPAKKLAAGSWVYLAVTFKATSSSTEVKLYRGTQTSFANALIASETRTGDYRLDDLSLLPFRLGARAEAPGIDVGCLSGTVDRLCVFDQEALDVSELSARHYRGLDTQYGYSPAYPPETSPLLEVDFEDPYGSVAANEPQLTGPDGTIVGHGTPGLSGRPSSTRGLRLNHDQVIDAGFMENVVTDWLTTDGMENGPKLTSKLYAIQAVFGSGSTYDRTSTENTRSNHYQAFVVRRDPSVLRKSVAVILPANTWTAYNAWPGDFGAYMAGGAGTAAGMTRRPDPSDPTKCFGQGNNSVYLLMGDGASPIHYAGWRRPNPMASPVANPDFLNEENVLMDMNVLRWLEGPPGTVWTTPIEYDLYTDHDLHSNLTEDVLREVSGEGYDVLFLVGHQEYWSETMLDRLHTFLARGGSVIRIGGNDIAWRSELWNTVDDGVTGVIEVKPWPMGVWMRGPWDSYSLMADPGNPNGPYEKTGSWRFIEQIQNPQGTRDVILGTLPDMAGYFGPSGDPAPFDQFGRWAVAVDPATNPHVFWGGASGPPQDERIGTAPYGLVIGSEADRFCHPSIPGDDNAPPFVWGKAGSLPTVLAYGTELDPVGGADPDDGLRAVKLKWDAGEWAEEFEFELDTLAGQVIPSVSHPFHVAGWEDVNSHVPEPSNPTIYWPYGQIVTYEHLGGGHVLSIGSISAPRGLLDPDVRLSELVERALTCMLLGTGCP